MDGLDEIKLSNNAPTCIYTIGDYVFYKTSSTNEKIYRVVVDYSDIDLAFLSDTKSMYFEMQAFKV